MNPILTIVASGAVEEFLKGETAANVYWVMAVAGTTAFVISAALSFFGGAGEAGDVDADDFAGGNAHADTGGADFKLISFRSLTAFFTFFGWSGVLWGGSGWGGFAAALAAGTVMMVVVALVLWAMLRLQDNGNLRPEDFVGRQGTVYLAIPAGRVAAGAVTVSVGTSTHQLAAVADAALATGAVVTVVEQVAERRFLVKPA
ncbi:MAG: hypothetical protein J6333_04780 [Planctomycetes bacterium]|nr:hypothetical protein [Planctomycetota bacterium]